MGELLSSSTKYTPYTVHVFPGGISGTMAPVQVNGLSSNGRFTKCGIESLVKTKETNPFGSSPNANHSHPSVLSKATWDMHPSLKTLLGDLCSDIDMNEAVKNSRIEGFPSKEVEVEDADSSLSTAVSHKLSIGAPEFVPSFLNSKPLSPSAMDLGSDPDPYLASSDIAQAATMQSTIAPSSVDRGEQRRGNKLNLMSESVSPSRPLEYSHSAKTYDLSNFTEERNLISFDGDFPLVSERSPTPKHFTSQHSFSSKDEQPHAASFEESFVPAFRGKQGEYARETQLISLEQNSRFDAPSLSQHYPKGEKFQNVVKDVSVAHPREEESYQVPQEPEARQPRHGILSALPIFKTYAEATNFYYSLLEEGSREKLFQDSLRANQSQDGSPSPPGLTHPSSMHSFDRPNWAAAPDEDMNPIQPNHRSRQPDKYSRSMSTRSNASFVGESLVGIQGDSMPRAPQSLDGNDHVQPGTNQFSDTNGSYDPPRDTDMYSSYALSDKGDRNGKSYPDKKGFPSRGSNTGYDMDNLEREIDAYHENLRAKATRASQAQSSRAKNGNGNSSSNSNAGGSYNDLEKEIDGFHDNLRAKAGRASQAQAARPRNGNGTPSSDNGKRGRDLSRRSLRGSGEEWVNNANWAYNENEGGGNLNGGGGDGGGWGCE